MGRPVNFHFLIGGGGLRYEGEVSKFSFSGGFALWGGGGGNFLGGGSYPSAYYGPGQSTGGDQVAKFPEASRI